MKMYLSGPMSGIPEFNAPKFREVAERFRGFGYEVVSPVELNQQDEVFNFSGPGFIDKKNGGASFGAWGYFLARDITLLTSEQFDGCILLTDWEKSWGARLEVLVFLRMGILRFRDERDFIIPLNTVISTLQESLDEFKLA